jgi:NOL1/NOP2/fmu family ribosome biogenesis protein
MENASTEPHGSKPKKGKKGKEKRPLLTVPNECKQWLAEANSYIYKVMGTEVVAVPADMEPLQALLSEQLYLLKSGVTLAELKGRDALPAHELALSTALRPDAFPRCELTYSDALRYLHREAIVLPSDTPRGFVIVTYRGVPIGFVKSLGNRANNLYPNEWRIRSGYFPEQEVAVI